MASALIRILTQGRSIYNSKSIFFPFFPAYRSILRTLPEISLLSRFFMPSRAVRQHHAPYRKTDGAMKDGIRRRNRTILRFGTEIQMYSRKNNTAAYMNTDIRRGPLQRDARDRKQKEKQRNSDVSAGNEKREQEQQREHRA